ncbi:MAG: protein-disulfide reductase DsbD N-terminal domain-containing protein [Muribaculaceae bacterium]|nr:protein-disulfide reductase DsbD N-terminal domain-containing protein [Muribaculaceae bacterium]
MKKYVFCLILNSIAFALAAQLPFAAVRDAVLWQADAAMAVGDGCTATLHAAVEPGWILYSTSLPEDDPRRTRIDLSGSRGVEFIGVPVPSEPEQDCAETMDDGAAPHWASDVSFSVPFRVLDPKEARIEFRVTYMACNGATCMPPKTETVTVNIVPEQ